MTSEVNVNVLPCERTMDSMHSSGTLPLSQANTCIVHGQHAHASVGYSLLAGPSCCYRDALRAPLRLRLLQLRSWAPHALPEACWLARVRVQKPWPARPRESWQEWHCTERYKN